MGDPRDWTCVCLALGAGYMGMVYEYSSSHTMRLSESESEVAQSCRTFCDPWTVAHQAPPSMGFSRQEY